MCVCLIFLKRSSFRKTCFQFSLSLYLGISKYSLITVKEMRKAGERLHKCNDFHNSSLQVYKEWSYLVRTMSLLAPCSVSDGNIKEFNSGVFTCSLFHHTFCNIPLTMTYQQSCNSPPCSSSRLR